MTKKDMTIENCMIRDWVMEELVEDLGWTPVVDLCSDCVKEIGWEFLLR